MKTTKKYLVVEAYASGEDTVCNFALIQVNKELKDLLQRFKKDFGHLTADKSFCNISFDLGNIKYFSDTDFNEEDSYKKLFGDNRFSVVELEDEQIEDFIAVDYVKYERVCFMQCNNIMFDARIDTWDGYTQLSTDAIDIDKVINLIG